MIRAGDAWTDLPPTLERESVWNAGSTADAARIPRERAMPLSFNQERYLLRRWFTKLQSHTELPFQMTVRLRLRGTLNADALQRALNEIVRRHEVLRTGYSPIRGFWAIAVVAPLLMELLRLKAIQKKVGATVRAGRSRWSLFRPRVMPAAPLPIRLVDVSRLDKAEQHQTLQHLEEIRDPFDLTRPPLIRAVLAKFSDDDHLLFLAVSHIAFDTGSEAILRREVALLYDSFSRGEPSRLPELPVQYADFAAWQRLG